MTAAPRKSLADKVRENEAAKNDSASPTVDTDETKNEGNPPEVTTEEPQEDTKEEKVVSPGALARANKMSPTNNPIRTYSGGGSVTKAAAEGATLTNTPSENALSRKKIEVEHKYAQPAHEVD